MCQGAVCPPEGIPTLQAHLVESLSYGMVNADRPHRANEGLRLAALLEF
jgi:hypothetical protein